MFTLPPFHSHLLALLLLLLWEFGKKKSSGFCVSEKSVCIYYLLVSVHVWSLATTAPKSENYNIRGVEFLGGLGGERREGKAKAGD
jgi:hypothetical protein